MEAEHPRAASTVAASSRARDRWPMRTRRLLDEIIPLCERWLEPALHRCVDRFDKELFQQADNAHGYLAQQRCFDSRTLLQQQRPAFVQACIDHLRNRFDAIGEVVENEAELTLDQPLSLLDQGEHELNAALDKLAARGESRHGPLLSELAYRCAVLVGSAPLEGARLPISPAGLAAALRAALDGMDLPPEHRLLLHSFEQAVIAESGTLYKAVNTQLLGDGLLPQLRPYAPVRGAPTDRATPAEQEQPATANNAEAASPGGGASQAPITVLETLRDLLAQRRVGVSGAAAAGRTATPVELETALDALQQHLAQVTDQASRELRSAQRLREELVLQLNAGKPPGATPTRLSAEQDDTVELVAMLFEQIGQQLHHGPQARSVLGGLQMPMLRMAVHDHDFFDQHEHPARRLLAAVTDAANDWLDGPDGDADRELGSRLRHLVDRAQHEPPSAGLYTTLLADIEHHLDQLNRRARAAERRHVEAMQGREKLELSRQRANELLTERFATHPPRGLLRTLLDRAWADVLALTLLQHGEDSPAFAQRLRVTDQLLGRLPVGDADLLRREVQAGLQQIGMHAEEASQVAQRLLGKEPAPAPVAAAPTQPAAAPLAGKASSPPAPVPPKAVPTQVAAPRPAAAAPTVAPVPTPTAPVPAGATKVATVRPNAVPAPGTPEPIRTGAATLPASTPSQRPAPAPASPTAVAATRTVAPPAPQLPAQDLPSATDLAQRLKQRQRLGEQQHTKEPTPRHVEPPLGPQEARIHNRLRQLPFGTWFEFTDPATGEVTQRKLAWFSPVSGNSLFVTRRGLRSDEMNLRELARAMANGQVRELPPQRDGLLDRAWNALAGNLKRGATATSTGARP